MHIPVTRSLCNVFNLHVSQARHKWIVKHALPIPPTLPGHEQRPPTDKHEFQRYTVVDWSELKPMPFAKIILLKNVEGIGKAGEIVQVTSHMVREFFLPSGSAVYASPYNVNKYTKLLGTSEDSSVEPHSKMGVSKALYDLTLFMNSKAVPVYVALENEWTLQKWHVTVALRLHGVFAAENQIVLDKQEMKGPNLKLQNRLFRFYIIANKRIVIPAYGRLQHVTTKTYRQMLTPTLPDPKAFEEQDARLCGIIEEDVHVHEPTPDNPDLTCFTDEQIWNLMQKKVEVQLKELEQHPVTITKREQAALDAAAKLAKDKQIHELRCKSFRLPLPPEPWDAEKLIIAKQRARRNRYWDDDLHNWHQPLGKP